MRRHHAPLAAMRHDGTDGTGGPLGPLGERLAAEHLAADGLEVTHRNWRLATGELRGELDLVALDHRTGTVVVVEVKARRSVRHGGPLVAVTPAKQARVRSLTAALLHDAELPYRRVRLDVVGLLLPPRRPGLLEHLPGAF